MGLYGNHGDQLILWTRWNSICRCPHNAVAVLVCTLAQLISLIIRLHPLTTPLNCKWLAYEHVERGGGREWVCVRDGWVLYMCMFERECRQYVGWRGISLCLYAGVGVHPLHYTTTPPSQTNTCTHTLPHINHTILNKHYLLQIEIITSTIIID